MSTPTDLEPPEIRIAAADALNCPLCGYDLRGLPENRCPECGHAFDPDELRRAKDERRNWLFEHALTRRLVGSFLRTTTKSLRPFTFWRSVSAAHVIHERRLEQWAAYWIAISVLATIVGVVAAAVVIYHDANGSLFGPGPVARRPWGASVDWRRAFDFAMQRGYVGPIALLGGIGLIWPAVTVLALAVFNHTLSRAGIRRGHLWRCVLYALPSILLPPIAVLLLGPWLFPITPRAVVLCGLAMLVLSTLHLAVAHVAYLRLRHAVAQAILVQLMVVLGMFTAFMVVATIGL